MGRHPKTGKMKGGIKVHTMIHANEGVTSDITRGRSFFGLATILREYDSDELL